VRSLSFGTRGGSGRDLTLGARLHDTNAFSRRLLTYPTLRVQCRIAAEPLFNRVISREGWQIQKAARRGFRPTIVTDLEPPLTLVSLWVFREPHPPGFRAPVASQTNLHLLQHRLQTPKHHSERFAIIFDARLGLLAASDAVDEMFEQG
jgi:hypothetical protein